MPYKVVTLPGNTFITERSRDGANIKPSNKLKLVLIVREICLTKFYTVCCSGGNSDIVNVDEHPVVINHLQVTVREMNIGMGGTLKTQFP